MVLFAKTVQRKLLLILLTVGMVPAAIGILHTYYGVNVGFTQVLEDLVRDEAQQSARRMDEILSRELALARSLQVELAHLQNAGSNSEVPEELLNRTEEFVNGLGSNFATATLIDSNGLQLYRMEKGTTQSQEISGSGRVPVEIPRGLYAGSSPRHFITDSISPRGAGLRILLILEDGSQPSPERPMILALDLAARDLLEKLRATGSGSELRIITSRSSLIIGGSPDDRLQNAVRNTSDIFDQYTGELAMDSPDSVRAVTGFATSRFLSLQRNEGRTSLSWLVLATMDMEEARTVGAFLLWRSSLLGLVLVPFLILLSTVLAQRFLQPLRQIHASLDRLAEGRMAARVTIKTGDEFEDLAQAYNRMAERIKQASLELLSQIRSSRRQAREVTLVHDVCQSLAAEFDRERLFETARKRLGEILRHDCMTAVVADPAGHSTLHHFAGGAVRQSIPANDILAFCQRSIRSWATNSNRQSGYFLTPHGGFANTGIPNPDCHELAVVPLLAGEILLGALILGRMSPDPFSEEELQAAKPIARFLAVAAEHIQLYERTVNFATELEATVRARTEQLETAHRQLLITERFAATGKLAANIAHEINNPLGIIKNYLRIHRNTLQGSLSPDSAEALTVMEEELDRIARIVRRLLDFYRTPSMEPTPTDLNSEIQNMLTLMGSTLNQKGIHVELHLLDQLPRVMLVPDLLRQVILNICKNAEEAMGDSGTLMVSTGVDSTEYLQRVRLEIADTGCGIPPEHLSQIFEPFFTSKAEGQGTGLGLAVTYGIVQGMGGTIQVESDVGLGTRFVLTFPAAESPDDPTCTTAESGTAASIP